jgi:UDP-N-acetylglucosamine--N-acetylmuramyl-(pentapeptide) pyrophosphoryl-undecaprenol N-acetylglucosamine transferase
VREIVAVGGGRAIAQPRFTAIELAKQMQRLALEPGALVLAAEKAASVGRPNATSDLADLVETFGAAPLMDVIRIGAGATSSRTRGARASATKESAQ